jgi:hypothetical protein
MANNGSQQLPRVSSSVQRTPHRLVPHHDAAHSAAAAKQLESVKHLLWHGNAEEALERLGGLLIELELLRAFWPAADKLGQGISEFETYVN